MLETAFRTLSRLRGARIFHPRGEAYRATLTIDGRAGLPGIPLFEPGSSRDAVVRVSRGAGFPKPLPDVIGVAFRVAELGQDVLLVTSGRLPVARRALVPALGTDGHWFSSLVSFDAAGRRLVVGAHAESPGRFRLHVAPPLGRWEPVGVLELGECLPDDVSHRLRFDPWHDGGGLVPVGLLNRLRAAAYPGSQEGRPDTSRPAATPRASAR